MYQPSPKGTIQRMILDNLKDKGEFQGLDNSNIKYDVSSRSFVITSSGEFGFHATHIHVGLVKLMYEHLKQIDEDI